MSDEREPSSDVSRRRFLTVLGTTSAGAAVLSGCSTEKVEKLIPYLVQSEDQVPGIPTWYASTCTECSAGCGLHVRVREGRPVKLEGNPENPINKGALCARGQAGLQGLYNPGRVRAPMVKQGGTWKEISWDDAIAMLAQKVGAASGKLAVISGAGRGTFSSFLGDWTGAAGGRVVRYQAFDLEPVRAANARVFGRDEIPAYDFGAAKYIVSFGADFLETFGSPHRIPAGLRRVPRIHARGASRPSTSTSRRARRSPASTPTSGMPSCPGPRRRSPSRWPAYCCSSVAAACPACRR